MAFWKKSEDPWDLEPKRSDVPAARFDEAAEEQPEEEPSLGDKARAFFGVEKKEPETPPAPIPCPWCGKLMETRYIWASEGCVYCLPERPRPIATTWSVSPAQRFDTDGGTFLAFKYAQYCPDCEKLVVDTHVEIDPEWQARLEQTMETHPQTAEDIENMSRSEQD